MSGILEGIRVVDLSRYIAGPFCSMMLADLGAEVIKIEKPGDGDITRTIGPWHDGISLFNITVNRNKKSVTADTRTPEGLAILKKLIAESDVLLENFRAGVMDKMGLSYEEVKKINPEIIYVSVSGFGHAGPWMNRLAFDGIISAVSGVTRIMPDHVERSKGAVNDHLAAMFATIGTLAAIIEKKATGKGQLVDVAMIASSAVLRSDAIADAYLNGDEAAMTSEDSAPYGYLRATNGWIIFYGSSGDMYDRLVELVQSPFLAEERFVTSMEERVEHKDELLAEIQKWADGRTVEELEELFKSKDLPYGIVATPGALLRNEHLNEMGYIVKTPVHGIEGDVPIIGSPIKLSNHPDLPVNPSPSIGENTEDVYKTVLGMTDSEIKELKDKGII